MYSTLRIAVRQLAKNPVMTLIAVVTLAAGIGLNTAMFSFANGVVLLPQPFPKSEQLVRVWRSTPGNNTGAFSPGDLLDLQQDGTEFGRFAGFHVANVAPSQGVSGTEWMRVTTDIFELLGVPPLRGRLFRPEEANGDSRVVLLSHGVWQDRFGADPDIVGQTIKGNGESYEIVGVLPEWATDHRLFGRAGLFSPMDLGPSAGANRDSSWIQVVARRRASVSMGQGNALLTSLATRAAAAFPKENEKATWRAEGLPQSTISPTGSRMLFMLLGLSGMVLLIACSNLAHLLLARTMERAREFAVRGALGASRFQILKPLIVESSLLTAIGGSSALFVAMATTRWLRSVIEGGGGPTFRFPLDWRVMAFATASCLATLVLFGVAPGLFATRIHVAEALKSGGRGVSLQPGHHRLRQSLIVGQFALTMVLLAGAGALLHGTFNLLNQSFGWNAEQVIQAEIQLAEGRYRSGEEILAFHRQALDQVAAIPGIQAASFSYGLPYLGLRGTAAFVVEGDRDSKDGTGTAAKVNAISPDYFEVTGTSLLAGRRFTNADTAQSPTVAIISHSLAQRLFPGQDPMGRRVAMAGATPPTWLEIVGVVADVRSIDVAKPPAPYQVYQTIAQDPRHTAVLAVRYQGVDQGAVTAALRSALNRLDPELQLRDLSTAGDLLRRVTSQMDFCRQLLFGFAVLGMGLAALGIYGVMSRAVAQRTGEIGIRMALGAQIRDVIGMILGSGIRIALMGATLGVLGGMALLRLLGSMLPSMETSSPWILGTGVVILGFIALAACYPPARRASRVEPMTALRAE